MNIDWEDEINSIDAPDLDEDGIGPPDIEIIKKVGKHTLTLDDKGKLTKIITEILIFEHEDGNTFTGEAHYMIDYGKRPLKDALLLLKEMKKKTT